MSVPERPDESVEWAESPHAEVEEPEELRLYGWPYGFVPPSAAFNWLQRSVGRWIKWLEAKVDGHVHDGGSEPGSVGKVDPRHHIDWEENGYLEATDGLGQHTITHGGSVDRDRRLFVLGKVIPTSIRVETPDKDHSAHIVPFESEGLDALFVYGKTESHPVSISILGRLYTSSGASFGGIGGVEIAGTLDVGGDLDVEGKINAGQIESPTTPVAIARVNGFSNAFDLVGENIIQSIKRDVSTLDGAYRIRFNGHESYEVMAVIGGRNSSVTNTNAVGVVVGTALDPDDDDYVVATVMIKDSDGDSTTADFTLFVYPRF